MIEIPTAIAVLFGIVVLPAIAFGGYAIGWGCGYRSKHTKLEREYGELQNTSNGHMDRKRELDAMLREANKELAAISKRKTELVNEFAKFKAKAAEREKTHVHEINNIKADQAHLLQAARAEAEKLRGELANETDFKHRLLVERDRLRKDNEVLATTIKALTDEKERIVRDRVSDHNENNKLLDVHQELKTKLDALDKERQRLLNELTRQSGYLNESALLLAETERHLQERANHNQQLKQALDDALAQRAGLAGCLYKLRDSIKEACSGNQWKLEQISHALAEYAPEPEGVTTVVSAVAPGGPARDACYSCVSTQVSVVGDPPGSVAPDQHSVAREDQRDDY